MITDWVLEELDKLAEEIGTTRSEVLERAIRCGGLEVAKEYNPETSNHQ
jgi:metal-responsive CopG/Arc/MetJ family transcriptional regulator